MKNLLKILIFSTTACVLIIGILRLSVSQPISKTTSFQKSILQSQSEPVRPKGFDQENDLSVFWTIALSLNFTIVLAVICYLIFNKLPKNNNP
jgi:anaerobic C4-dicarboxylate transporter